MKDKNNISYWNIELIKDIWNYIKPYKAKFYLWTFARLTSDIVWLFPVWALAEIITFVSNYKTWDSTTYVWQLMGAIFFIAIYHFIFHEYAKYLIYQVAENANIDAQKNTTKYLYDLNMDWHEKENAWNKMQKIVKWWWSLNEIIRLYVELVIESSVNLVAILIILSTVNIYFAFILGFFFISYYLLSYFLTKKAVHQSHLTNLEWEKFNWTAFESVNNISIIKSLKIGDKISIFLNKIDKILRKRVHKRIYYYRLRALTLYLYQEFFRLLIISFTLWQIFSWNLEVWILVMVLLYFGKIEQSAFEFAETYSEFVRAKIAISRMKEILNTKPTIENSWNKDFNSNWEKLNLKNITFSYHWQNVLKNFSLEIKKWEKIWIIWISWTWKSTLFKLLLKLYDNYKWEILFDNNSLHDIKRSSYMEKVATVPQDTELFNLSLKENITLSEENIDENNLEKSLKIAHIKDFAHKLPKWIESLVWEKWIKLSGWEKQRVWIARAIYKKPEILLLDEATSHLDIESEKNIQEALHTFFKDITAIVIAHRLSTIKEMDKIVIMKDWEVLEMWSFDELIKLKWKFFELWGKQKM